MIYLSLDFQLQGVTSGNVLCQQKGWDGEVGDCTGSVIKNGCVWAQS